jgi:hypothetical protein
MTANDAREDLIRVLRLDVTVHWGDYSDGWGRRGSPLSQQ